MSRTEKTALERMAAGKGSRSNVGLKRAKTDGPGVSRGESCQQPSTVFLSGVSANLAISSVPTNAAEVKTGRSLRLSSYETEAKRDGLGAVYRGAPVTAEDD